MAVYKVNRNAGDGGILFERMNSIIDTDIFALSDINNSSGGVECLYIKSKGRGISLLRRLNVSREEY